MNDLSVGILSALTSLIAIAAIVIIIAAARKGIDPQGRNRDLALLLGIAWLLGGLATENYVVSIAGIITLIIGFILRKRELDKEKKQ